MHIRAQGVFVAGAFFDAIRGKYVVRLVDMNRQYDPVTIYHATHILGGGFIRMNMDLCYFSMSIDGVYVITSARRGKVLRTGTLQDLLQPGITTYTPTCVSVVEDGMAFVGTLEHQLFVINIELSVINSLAKTTFIPRAVDAIRLRGVRGEYLLAWTSMNGDVVTGHTTRRVCGQEIETITTTSHDRLGDTQALIHIHTSERSIVTAQSDMGDSYLLHDGKTQTARCLAVPSPCLSDLVWNSNEKDQVALCQATR